MSFEQLLLVTDAKIVTLFVTNNILDVFLATN